MQSPKDGLAADVNLELKCAMECEAEGPGSCDVFYLDSGACLMGLHQTGPGAGITDYVNTDPSSNYYILQ